MSDSKTYNIACVGDSITRGYGLIDPLKDSYPVILQQLMGEQFLVRNFGVNGATVLRNTPCPYAISMECEAALEWNPDIAVLELGANDILYIPGQEESFIFDYKCIIEAFMAIRESKEESAFWFWDNAAVDTCPALISLYCLQQNYDSAVEIFNEYLAYLDDIYDGPMSRLERLSTDYVASSITEIRTRLCDYFDHNMEVFLKLIRKCERFINFCDDENSIFDYYTFYAGICEICGQKDSKEYKRVNAEAIQAKKRMNNYEKGKI